MMIMNRLLLSCFFVLVFTKAAHSDYRSADDDLGTQDNYLLIDKSDYTITLYDRVDWVIQWPCTFGNNDQGDKLYQGDRRTPEGRYTITSISPHAKWHKFMRLDYPTAADRQKFEQRKAEGIIPKNAKIGGDIGIHGTWPREEWAIETVQNWTLGCISMRNDHLDELYRMIGVGTKVIIRR
jgi:murein L,D-transpeptidase YafK